MKLLEFEAKDIFRKHGIPVPEGTVITSPDELYLHMDDFADEVVVKSQVDVGGRGKAGGIIVTKKADVVATAIHLFKTPIKGLKAKTLLVEEKLPIEHEYYVSITIDRATRQPMIIAEMLWIWFMMRYPPPLVASEIRQSSLTRSVNPPCQ